MEILGISPPWWANMTITIVAWWGGVYLLYRQIFHFEHVRGILKRHLLKRGNLVVDKKAPWHKTLGIKSDTKDVRSLRIAHERLVQAMEHNSPLFRMIADEQFQILDDALESGERAIRNTKRRTPVKGGLPVLYKGKEQKPDVLNGDCWRSILGVHKDDDITKIRKAFRRKAMKFHPDREGSSQAMSKLNLAFAVAEQEMSKKTRRRQKANV